MILPIIGILALLPVAIASGILAWKAGAHPASDD